MTLKKLMGGEVQVAVKERDPEKAAAMLTGFSERYAIMSGWASFKVSAPYPIFPGLKAGGWGVVIERGGGT